MTNRFLRSLYYAGKSTNRIGGTLDVMCTKIWSPWYKIDSSIVFRMARDEPRERRTVCDMLEPRKDDGKSVERVKQ